MKREVYQALLDLVEIFNGCIVNGKEVYCFRLIKEIIDGEKIKEDISEDVKSIARIQVCESMEWLESLGVTTKYQTELLEIIS